MAKLDREVLESLLKLVRALARHAAREDHARSLKRPRGRPRKKALVPPRKPEPDESTGGLGGQGD
jgi:hypothetical protein